MNVKIYKNKGSVYIEIDGGNADQIAKKFADALTSGFVTELKGLMPVLENDFVAIPKEAVQEYSVSEKSQDDAWMPFTKQEEEKGIMLKSTEEKSEKESIPKLNGSDAKNDSENNESYDESLFI